MEVAEDHSRVIIHVDIDCFYAQVETNKNPELSQKPVGVQQKNIVVTCNYVARDYGIKKCMLVEAALKLCPNLVLVKGEDLHDYRQISYKITTHLQKFSAVVERLGLDENFIDVTQLVKNKFLANSSDRVEGHIFGDTSDKCRCGCEIRLKVGSNIADEIRSSIKKEFNLTCCAGIAHNKLLAKLVGATHKPNQQTTVLPNNALELLYDLKFVSKLPGIGKATTDVLNSLNINTIKNLQECNLEQLISVFGCDKARLLKDLCFGRDNSPVKQTGRPQSIGLEDSCYSLSFEAEVKEKFLKLLNRLMVLVEEDGRIPKTIKLTIRKFDKINKISHRETKQCNVSPSLFTVANKIKLSKAAEQKLMTVIMHLFMKLVDVRKPYHITLLGLSFTKFQEIVSNSIANYFKKNVEVQSLTSIENKIENPHLLMEYSTATSQSGFNTDGSETELEPSPKKKKLTTVLARRRFNMGSQDCLSPSKLNVAELRLNSKDSDCSEENNQTNACPPDVDVEVFSALPLEMQQEVWQDFKRKLDRDQNINNQIKKTKSNTILNYLIKN